jgi:hypothetical protein
MHDRFSKGCRDSEVLQDSNLVKMVMAACFFSGHEEVV